MAATAIAAAATTLMALHAPAAFSLSVGPPVIHLAAGQTATVKVTDSGSEPLTIHDAITGVSKSAANGKCGITGPASGFGVSVGGPGSFTLNPGQFRTVPVTAAANAVSADDAVMFASTAGSSGNAQISGSVGSQVVIGGSQECVSALPAPASHGLPPAAVGGLAGALIAGLYSARHLVSRRRRRLQPAAA
jgi:hypothetical protein